MNNYKLLSITDCNFYIKYSTHSCKYSMQPHNSPECCKVVYHHEKEWHKRGYHKPRQHEGWGKIGCVLTEEPFTPSWMIKQVPEPIWCRNQSSSSISQPHHFSELVFQVSNVHTALWYCVNNLITNKGLSSFHKTVMVFGLLFQTLGTK